MNLVAGRGVARPHSNPMLLEHAEETVPLETFMFCIFGAGTGTFYWLQGGTGSMLVVVALLSGCGAVAGVKVARYSGWI